ncbi:hypothetical protein [Ruegeria arenilitoris]|uniref:hypothetical protein n=1 Tax=Ruegeria arenilitoris TaxID=1173585 RepID=UPI001481CCA7|nr:hypothetical protein [Ruegeria arenilitoris]
MTQGNDSIVTSGDERSTVYLHIGFSKTGTTALQQFFYNNRDHFDRQGIYYPDNFRNPENGYSDWGHHILSHKWGGWLNPKVFPITPDDAWDRTAELIAGKPGSYIISSERFQDILGKPDSAEILRFIEKKVAPSRLAIVAYIRRQDDFAESHYKELVKNNFHKGTFSEYLANLPAFFRYDEFLESCCEVVAKENIIVRVYNRSLFPGGSIFADFLDAIGTGELGANLHHEAITNASLNSALASLMGNKQMKPLWAEKTLRHELYQFFNNRTDLVGANAPLLSEGQRADILAQFADSNARLSERFLPTQQARALEPPAATGVESFNENRPIYSTNDVKDLLKAASQERDVALQERDVALQERDVALQERDVALQERDVALQERDVALQERDVALQERDVALQERDVALQERDVTLQERDVALKERDHARKYPWKYIRYSWNIRYSWKANPKK